MNLKPNNLKANNRPNSNIRKRSAFKYIEDNLEKDKITEFENNGNVNININNPKENNSNSNKNINFINNINQGETNQGFFKDNKKIDNNNNKPKIIAESNINKFLQNINGIEGNNNNSEKKIEYESRRKKPMNFINGIDNFSSGNGNLNDKNYKGGNKNIINKEIIGYESRRQINFHKNNIKSKEKESDNKYTNKNSSKI